MTLRIHRPRQVIGWIYSMIYLAILLGYGFVLEDDRSWMAAPMFTATVAIWFLLSLSVKVAMATDRVVELLNVAAMVAFLSIGFSYHPNPDNPNAIQSVAYYLYLTGGPACDVFDFIYEGAAKGSEGRLAGPEN